MTLITVGLPTHCSFHLKSLYSARPIVYSQKFFFFLFPFILAILARVAEIMAHDFEIGVVRLPILWE